MEHRSSSQTSTGTYVPITPKCVKPLLIANKDPSPGGSGPIVNVTTGQNLVPNLVGQQFSLTDPVQQERRLKSVLIPATTQAQAARISRECKVGIQAALSATRATSLRYSRLLMPAI